MYKRQDQNDAQAVGFELVDELVDLFLRPDVDAAGRFIEDQMCIRDSMNTITLADLTDDNASSGNSLLAVTQQLSISLGVAISAAAVSYTHLDVYKRQALRTIELYHIAMALFVLELINAVLIAV